MPSEFRSPLSQRLSQVTSRCKFSQLVSQLLHVYHIHLILENVFFGAGL